MRKILTVTLIVLLLSCGKKEDHSYIKNHLEFENVLTLKLVGERSLPLTKEMGFINNSISFFGTGNDEYLSFLNFFNNKIVVYDFKNRAIIKEIELLQEGPHGVGALPAHSTHLMISSDSFLVYNGTTKRLFLVNDSSNVLTKYDLIDVKQDEVNAVPLASNVNPMLLIGDNVYIPCAINNMRTDYAGYNVVLRVNLLTKEKEYMYSLPKEYNEEFWGVYFKYLPSLTYNKYKNDLVVNFPASHELVVGDESGHVKNVQHVGSRYIDGYMKGWGNDLSKGLETPSNAEYKDMSDYSLTHSDYGSIKFDSVRRLYYRIVFVRPDLEKIKTGNRSPDISIIIMNESFEKIGEVLIDGDVYDHSMIFVNSDGINLPRKDLYRQDENHIVFETFQPVEIE